MISLPARDSIAPECVTDVALLAAAVLILADGLMTLPFWSLEGNPVVLAIGPIAMLTTKIVGVAALLWLWFSDRSPRGSIVATATPWILLGMHSIVVGTNAAVLAVVG